MQTSFFKKLLDWLGRNLPDIFFVSIILGVGIFVAYKNFLPNTWLLGWDSLVPELNFKLNVGRSLSATWQEYQGLGLLGGMAHAADLPRMVFLWASSLFISQSFLRYFWTFLMLIAGPVGVYFLVSGVLIREKSWGRKFAGLAAAMFYLFNLATVATFYVPFETFTSFFGFFPWLLFLALRFLEDGGKGKILSFFLFSILSASAFYVQTLFVVYAIFLSVFALEAIIRLRKTGFLRSFYLSIITFAVSAFWLLPVLYFSLTAASVPGNSHINSIATPETELMNQARGSFSDVIQLKGYWFDYYDWFSGGNSTKGNYDYMYKNWIAYDENPLVGQASFILFFAASIGILVSLLRKKTAYAMSFLILFGVSFIMLSGTNPPTGQLYQLLTQKIPFFSDVFRNSYTKWATAFGLILAVGLGYFVNLVSGILKGKLRVFTSIILALGITSIAIFTVYPVFSGNLISKNMEVNLPNSYIETINYFSGVDHTARIADFPLTDFWGWHFNSWGFEGSGFMWYGIPQPILDRTFDVWNPLNEDFYSEVNRAVIAKDPMELTYVLNKYQVSYILFDGNVFEPGNDNWGNSMKSQKDFLETSGILTKVKDFDNISIYRVNLSNPPDAFVSAPESDFSKNFETLGNVSKQPEITETFSQDRGYQKAKNCDLKNQGSVVKIRQDGGNFYSATGGGTSCDYFYYPSLSSSKAYSMRIVGDNTRGRSLKFYLFDMAFGQNIMEELLPSGHFDKSYYIYPTHSKATGNGGGYTLNVETRSFGDIKSENKVTGIYFYPVDFSVSDGPESLSNNLKITAVKKYGTWGYMVEASGSGLLELGQGYDSGWIAIEPESFHFPFSNFQLLEHTKVNDWANGWTVSSSCSQMKIGNCELLIVFWPQFLEWGGGLIGILALVVLLVKRSKKYPII